VIESLYHRDILTKNNPVRCDWSTSWISRAGVETCTKKNKTKIVPLVVDRLDTIYRYVSAGTVWLFELERVSGKAAKVVEKKKGREVV